MWWVVVVCVVVWVVEVYWYDCEVCFVVEGFGVDVELVV